MLTPLTPLECKRPGEGQPTGLPEREVGCEEQPLHQSERLKTDRVAQTDRLARLLNS